jgi:hypothetical protein
LEHGVIVYGGDHGMDVLAVLGTSRSDHIAVEAAKLTVNGNAAAYQGFELMGVFPGAGRDRVRIADDAGARVYVVDPDNSRTGRQADAPTSLDAPQIAAMLDSSPEESLAQDTPPSGAIDDVAPLDDNEAKRRRRR